MKEMSFWEHLEELRKTLMRIVAILGVALIVAPHIVGAPQPDSFETAIPEGLHHQFVVAVTLTNLVFWLVLGVVVGVVRGRFTGTATSLRDSFA